MRESTKARHEMVIDAYFQVIAELKSIRGKVSGMDISMYSAIPQKVICAMVCEKVKIYSSEDVVYKHINQYIKPMSHEEFDRRLNEKISLLQVQA